jgi:hypothetical protein
MLQLSESFDRNRIYFLAHFLQSKKPRFSGVPPPKTAAAARPSNL